MSRNSSYARGDWNAACAICGNTFKASTMVKNWKGSWVCQADFEPRHPQDFVRPIGEPVVPPWVQSRDLSHFLPLCSSNGRSAVAGFAEPGCVIPGNIDVLFDRTIF